MANTRLSPEGAPIGDPNGDLDYVARGAARLAMTAETTTPEARFMEKFDWIPHWGGEVTLAVAGLGTRLNENGKYHIRAVEKTLEQVDGYKVEALRDTLLLRKAFAVRDEIDSLSPREIIDKPDILRILAKQQLFNAALRAGTWPSHRKDSLEKKLSPLILKLYGTSDEVLVGSWHETFASTKGRGRFWLDERNRVQDNPWVVQADHEARRRMLSR
jgi:hypothetical protein